MPNLLDGLITRRDIVEIAEGENLILDDDDRISILESMRSIDVQACPGSGKTTLIATKLILLAKKWPFQHQGVCVLSHTNVAKDEIIERLKKSKTIEAQRLLTYPHFIGTIQEFVGKYVAFPLIRSLGIKIKHVDTDNCIDLIYRNLQRSTRNYVDKKSQYSNVLYDFGLKLEGAGLLLTVPTFPNGSNSASYNDLKSVRERLYTEGYFFYKDIYAYAELALLKNDQLKAALRERFGFVFLDEMQDTQKFQDELLNKIFPIDAPTLIVQRFGDPDQAIFNGINGEESNESFNGKSAEDMNVVINRSHRFNNSIAVKIRNQSFNEINLESELSVDSLAERLQYSSEGRGFKHTVIIYRDQTRGDVISTFADIVSRQFSAKHKKSDKFLVKVVGAVGNEIDPNSNQLKIGHYWNSYDKTKSKNNFKEGTLIEAVYYCRKSSSSDWASGYRLITDCTLRLLRKADKKDGDGKYFSASTLRDFLKDTGNWWRYRRLIHLFLNNDILITQRRWTRIGQHLSNFFDFNNISVDVKNYLEFHTETENAVGQDDYEPDETLVSLPDNQALHPDGFRIELSTIHGVKGETHDATLVLETKNFCFDLDAMMPYITKERPDRENPNSELSENVRSRRANRQFMRQLYVAMSRPKHLLCLAIHSDRISTVHKAALGELGWSIRELIPLVP